METNIIELEHSPVFTIKNCKALKQSKHKGFSVFMVYMMLIVAPKYGENETKSAKNPIFSSLKAL